MFSQIRQRLQAFHICPYTDTIQTKHLLLRSLSACTAAYISNSTYTLPNLNILSPNQIPLSIPFPLLLHFPRDLTFLIQSPNSVLLSPIISFSLLTPTLTHSNLSLPTQSSQTPLDKSHTYTFKNPAA